LLSLKYAPGLPDTVTSLTTQSIAFHNLQNMAEQLKINNWPFLIASEITSVVWLLINIFTVKMQTQVNAENKMTTTNIKPRQTSELTTKDLL